MIAPMGTPQTVRLTIELDRGEPIAGRIGLHGEPPRSFRGWLELTNKIERLRDSPSHNREKRSV